MNAPLWVLWLGGTVLPLGALWLVWQLALRAEQCYGYNRALLLLAPLLAAALPLLPHPAVPAWLSSGPAAAVGPVLVLPTLAVAEAPAPDAAGWSGWEWLFGIYVAGVGLGLGRLVWQVLRLYWLAHRLPREAGPGYVLLPTTGQLPTSTFGRVIFWNETAALAPAEAAAVLAHEVAHVRQRHTLDVLWLEIWRAVLWPNPFAHLLLPALRLTHELLADRAAAATVAAAGSAATYPALLARLAAQRLVGPAAFSLLHPFTFSFTLTRIALLQHQIPVRRWKQWLVLPVLGALSFVGSHSASAQAGPTGRAQITPVLSEAQLKERQALIRRKVREAEHQDSLRTGGKVEPGMTKQFNITQMDGPGEPVVTITRIKKPVPPVGNVSTTADGAKVYTYVEQMPQLPQGGGLTALVNQIQNNFVYPNGAHLQGRVFANFIVNASGEVQDARIVKSLSEAYDEAVLNAIRSLPRFVPGKQNGKPVAVSFTVPITFKDKP